MTSWDISSYKIFSKYWYINIVTDSYEITDAITYNVYVLQNSSVYLNGIDVID